MEQVWRAVRAEAVAAMLQQRATLVGRRLDDAHRELRQCPVHHRRPSMGVAFLDVLLSDVDCATVLCLGSLVVVCNLQPSGAGPRLSLRNGLGVFHGVDETMIAALDENKATTTLAQRVTLASNRFRRISMGNPWATSRPMGTHCAASSSIPRTD